MREFHLARGFLLNSQAENRARLRKNGEMGLGESNMKATRNHSLPGRGVAPAPQTMVMNMA